MLLKKSKDAACQNQHMNISAKQPYHIRNVTLHAEEDGEGVAYEPGNAEPKQGQSLLPTGKNIQ